MAPFRIDIPQDQLDDLAMRLRLTWFAEPLDGSAWTHGTPPGYLAELVAEESGYSAIQATRPQTLAAGLHDSPAGLAAWIVEKFRAWSDCAGDVEMVYSKDELLTNVMIYWLTGTVGTSARLYYEAKHDPSNNPAGFVPAPAGFASFPKELIEAPEELTRRVHDLRRFTRFDHGGHVAAMERPVDLVHEFREFFCPLR